MQIMLQQNCVQGYSLGRGRVWGSPPEARNPPEAEAF